MYENVLSTMLRGMFIWTLFRVYITLSWKEKSSNNFVILILLVYKRLVYLYIENGIILKFSVTKRSLKNFDSFRLESNLKNNIFNEVSWLYRQNKVDYSFFLKYSSRKVWMRPDENIM